MAAGKRSKNATPTYAALQQQISQLQKQAERLRAAEVAGVIERIREAIPVYNLSVADLFGAAPTRKTKRADTSAAVAAAPKKASVAKYRDPASGKTWTGVGKRPGWFVAAVEGGADLQTLSI